MPRAHLRMAVSLFSNTSSWVWPSHLPLTPYIWVNVVIKRRINEKVHNQPVCFEKDYKIHRDDHATALWTKVNMKYIEAAHMVVTENLISHTSIHLQVL